MRRYLKYPRVLQNIILNYLPDRELLPWIDNSKLDFDILSKNPAAIHLLEANPDKIDWDYLSKNPAAIHILMANPNKIDWGLFSENPVIFDLVPKPDIRLLL